MNHISISGRLVADPELRFTQTGKAVAHFSLAVNYRGSEDANFFDFVAWEKTAEVMAEHLHKGRKILVGGHLKQRRWETPEGDKRSKVEIIVDTFEFADNPKAEGDKQIVPVDEAPEEESPF